jgi:hypothetical protein
MTGPAHPHRIGLNRFIVLSFGYWTTAGYNFAFEGTNSGNA